MRPNPIQSSRYRPGPPLPPLAPSPSPVSPAEVEEFSPPHSLALRQDLDVLNEGRVGREVELEGPVLDDVPDDEGGSHAPIPPRNADALVGGYLALVLRHDRSHF